MVLINDMNWEVSMRENTPLNHSDRVEFIPTFIVM